MATASDICVVGGGPAGLATAIACAQRGLRVTVFDGRHPPIDKACGEGILPEGVRALETLGVTIPREHSHPIRGIAFFDAERSDDAPIAASFSSPSFGIRRTALHSALVDRAEALGVELRWDTAIHTTPNAAFVVNALGMAAAPSNARTLHQRYGFRRHYRIAPWNDHVEVHWSSVGQLYITPVAADEVGVALLTSDPRLRLDAALPHFPAVASRLQNAAATSTERGAVTASRWLSHVTSATSALIGDCAGSADAITGDGLSLAFANALDLASAISSGNHAAYDRAHRRSLRRAVAMGELLLLLDRQPRLRRRVFHAFRRRPELFARMLAVHTGQLSPARLFAISPLALVRALL